MSYQVLARKYRPQTFSSVLGQEHITKTLQNAIASSRIHHAYLFTGVRGVGKTTVARIFSKALNCEKAPAEEPCNICKSCSDITNGTYMDVQEIDGASNTGVDDVREIRERIKYLPSQGKYKVYIIDEVHMLSTAAFNALLKTLEEPPSHVIFIFATTEPEKIPATILSRCQRHDFRRLPIPTIIEMIREMASHEGITVEPDAAVVIANEADGSARDAQSLFDQAVAFSGKKVGYNSLKEMLGFMDKLQLKNLLTFIVKKDVLEALKIVEDIFNQGGNLVRLSQEMLGWIRNILVCSATHEQTFLRDIPAEDREFINELSSKRDESEWEQFFRICHRQAEDLTRSKYPKMLLESLVIQLVNVRPVQSVDVLIDRIDKMIDGGKNTSCKNDKQVKPVFPTDISNPADRKVIGEKEWHDFLGWLHGKKPQVASVLEHTVFVGGGAGRVCLECSSASIYGGMLQEPDRKRQVEELIEKHFGRKYIVEFKILNDGVSTQELRMSKVEEKRERTKKIKEEALNHDVIKGAASILGADIKEIKIKEVKE